MLSNARTWLIGLLLIASVLSALTAVWRFYIEKDYVVFMNITCDPSQYSCFVGDGEDTPQYYARLTMEASALPVCNASAGECTEPVCLPNDQRCSLEYCVVGRGDTCFGTIGQ